MAIKFYATLLLFLRLHTLFAFLQEGTLQTHLNQYSVQSEMRQKIYLAKGLVSSHRKFKREVILRMRSSDEEQRSNGRSGGGLLEVQKYSLLQQAKKLREEADELLKFQQSLNSSNESPSSKTNETIVGLRETVQESKDSYKDNNKIFISDSQIIKPIEEIVSNISFPPKFVQPSSNVEFSDGPADFSRILVSRDQEKAKIAEKQKVKDLISGEVVTTDSQISQNSTFLFPNMNEKELFQSYNSNSTDIVAAASADDILPEPEDILAEMVDNKLRRWLLRQSARLFIAASNNPKFDDDTKAQAAFLKGIEAALWTTVKQKMESSLEDNDNFAEEILKAMNGKPAFGMSADDFYRSAFQYTQKYYQQDYGKPFPPRISRIFTDIMSENLITSDLSSVVSPATKTYADIIKLVDEDISDLEQDIESQFGEDSIYDNFIIKINLLTDYYLTNCAPTAEISYEFHLKMIKLTIMKAVLEKPMPSDDALFSILQSKISELRNAPLPELFNSLGFSSRLASVRSKYQSDALNITQFNPLTKISKDYITQLEEDTFPTGVSRWINMVAINAFASEVNKIAIRDVLNNLKDVNLTPERAEAFTETVRSLCKVAILERLMWVSDIEVYRVVYYRQFDPEELFLMIKERLIEDFTLLGMKRAKTSDSPVSTEQEAQEELGRLLSMFTDERDVRQYVKEHPDFLEAVYKLFESMEGSKKSQSESVPAKETDESRLERLVEAFNAYKKDRSPSSNSDPKEILKQLLANSPDRGDSSSNSSSTSSAVQFLQRFVNFTDFDDDYYPSEGERLVDRYFDESSKLTGKVIGKEGAGILQRVLLQDIYRTTFVKLHKGSVIFDGKLMTGRNQSQFAEQLESRFNSTGLSKELSYLFFINSLQSVVQYQLPDQMVAPEDDITLVIYPRAWNSTALAAKQSKLSSIGRSLLSTFAFISTVTFCADSFGLTSTKLLDPDYSYPPALLYMILTSMGINTIAQAAEAVVAKLRGVEILQLTLPGLNLPHYGTKAIMLTMPKNKKDVFDIAAANIGTALGLSLAAMFAGLSIMKDAPKEVVAQYPTVPIGLLQLNNFVEKFLSSQYENIFGFQFMGDESVHLHWLTIVGAASFMSYVFQLIPEGRTVGQRLAFSLLGDLQYKLLYGLTLVLRFFLVMFAIFGVAGIGSNDLTRLNLVVDYCIFSVWTTGDQSEPMLARDGLTPVNEPRKLIGFIFLFILVASLALPRDWL